jgi:hypothetical protein
MIRVTGILFAILLLTIPAPPGQAQQQDGLSLPSIVVRETLRPETGAVVGQRVALYVDVLFPDEMPMPPRLAPPEIPGAQVFRFESQATTMSERIDGRDHVGQRFEFAVYARRGGELTVPPVTVTVIDRAQNIIGEVHGSAVTLRIDVPEGLDAFKPVVASRRVRMSQMWTPDPATVLKPGLKPGDALKRTIRREASDVPGLALQAPELSAPEGVRIYADPPQIDDSISRGEVTGRRLDQIVYVFEKEGSYTLPAMTQAWFDLSEKVARMETASAVTVNVVAGPAVSAGVNPGVAQERSLSRAQWAMLAALALGLAAVVVIISKYWWRLQASWRKWHSIRLSSEKTIFKELERACLTGDAHVTYRALKTWTMRCEQGGMRPDTSQEPLHGLVSELESALFRPNPTPEAWTAARGGLLADCLRSARRIMLARSVAPLAGSALPLLNPARQIPPGSG